MFLLAPTVAGFRWLCYVALRDKQSNSDLFAECHMGI